jgi:hypothetical protein
MARRRRESKPRKVPYELLAPTAPEHKLLKKLVRAHHDDISEARIALAWFTSWRADPDGRITLGKCRRATDLDRELAEFDFVIVLNKTFWQDLTVTDHQRAALLDHELTHAAVVHDKNGEPKYDERGRKVFRVRRHDLEEFAAIAARYGTYKRDLEIFAAALIKGKQRELPMDDKAALGAATQTH